MSETAGVTPGAAVDEWLTTADVGALIGQSPDTIRRWRKENRGPKWTKPIHQVRYLRSDVDAWMRRGAEQPSSERT